MSIADLRREYARARLDEKDVNADPLAEFARWFAEAEAAEVPEPNAMSLATATPEGMPSARIVLLKHFDARGFVFFTDYRSQKGRELEANPQAALVFYWGELERQIRIAGTDVAARLNAADAVGHPVVPEPGQVWFDGQHGRVFFYSPGAIELVVPGE